MPRFVLPTHAVAMLAVATCLAAGLATAPGARAEDPAPAPFLAAARAKHADLLRAGAQSFAARIRLRRADDENVMRVRDQIEITYTFTAPESESFDFHDSPESIRKPLRDALAGLWREATGALAFPYLDGAEDLKLERSPQQDVLTGTSKVGGAFRATFDVATGQLAGATFADQVTRAWTCAATPKGFQPRRMDVSAGGALVYSVTYDVFRGVRGHAFPTVVRFHVNEKATEFFLEYVRLDDHVASAEPVDAAVVKARIEEFEKGWKGWDDATKVAKLREVADYESDPALQSVAKLGLKDASPFVRENAAEALGAMRRGIVVPALLAALPANEKEIRVYLRVIEALGDIGDARAVDPLSKDWWNQRVGEYGVAAANAKVAALGKIRDASSVDALIDTFTIASEDRLAGIRPNIVASLKKLTGRDFAFDRKAWGDWWKKNKSSFRF